MRKLSQKAREGNIPKGAVKRQSNNEWTRENRALLWWEASLGGGEVSVGQL